MSKRVLVVLSVTAVLGSVCGKRVPEPVGVVRGVPHVSWVIMAADAGPSTIGAALIAESNSVVLLTSE